MNTKQANKQSETKRVLAGNWRGPAWVFILAALVLPMIAAGSVTGASVASCPQSTSTQMAAQRPNSFVVADNSSSDQPQPSVNWDSGPAPLINWGS